MWISRSKYEALEAAHEALLKDHAEVLLITLRRVDKYHNHYVATRGHMVGIERLRRKVKRLEDENQRLQEGINFDYGQDDAMSVALRDAEAL